MSTRALTRVENPAERAYEASALVRGALNLLKERGVELDLQAMAVPLLQRVCQRYSLRMDKEAQLSQAQAHLMLLINLGLSRATNNEVERAASALERNPIANIYLIGEKLVSELAPRIQAVLKNQVVSIVHAHMSYWFELLDSPTRDRLQRWQAVGPLMADGLPPVDMAAYQECISLLERAETDVSVGRKVNWTNVLFLTERAAFAREYFRRAKRDRPARAGIWEPLLRSLFINAMIMESWTRPSLWKDENVAEIHRCVFVDPTTLALWLERVLFEPEELLRQFPAALVRVGLTLKANWGTAVFTQSCSDTEVDAVLARSQDLLRDLADETRTFYLAVENTSHVTPEELERYWATRVMLTSTQDVWDRLGKALAEEQEPWLHLDRPRNLVELAGLLSEFSRWSPEQQERLFTESSRWQKALQVDRPRETMGDMRALERILRNLGRTGPTAAMRFAASTDWSAVPIVVIATLAQYGSDDLGDPIVEIVKRAATDRTRTRIIVERAMDTGLFGRILKAISATWTEADWISTIETLCSSTNALRAIWESLPAEQKPLIHQFAKQPQFEYFLRDTLTPEEQFAFLEQSIAWATTQERKRSIRWIWYIGQGTSAPAMNVLPVGDLRSRAERLLKQLT